MPRTRVQQQQETDRVFLPVTDMAGVAFSNGLMTVNGRPQRPVRVEHWESSNGLTTYTCVEWQDPATGERHTSCNCPGWTHKRGSSRSCCHTKDMEGEKPCQRKRIESVQITSVKQAVEEIPDLHDGRELRGIML